MKVRKVLLNDDNLNILNKMESICYPEDKPYNKKHKAEWWFAYDDKNIPVGFGGATYWKPDNYIFLCLSGVVPSARGNGLQRKLIKSRLRWGKSINAKGAYTYAARYNLISANNLIDCGFKLFKPTYYWGLEDAFYLYKTL